MAKIGLKRNSLRKQKVSAELEAIIEEMGRAMRSAYKPYIATYEPRCQHELQIPFTPHMQGVWGQYVDWCKKYGAEDHI